MLEKDLKIAHFHTNQSKQQAGQMAMSAGDFTCKQILAPIFKQQ